MPSATARDIANSDRPAPKPMLDLLARLIRDVESGEPQLADKQASIPVENYYSQARYEQERDVLFRKFPLIVGHESELPEPGTCLKHDAAGLPLLLTRDAQGQIHAFLNVCRHRGMQILEDEAPCKRKTLVCPYHGWTYELDGRLRHMPHPEFFPNENPANIGLVALPCAVRNGLIWVTPTEGDGTDIDQWLGSLTDDFAYLGLDDSVLYRKVDVVRDCNWKLIIDAFLEAYHVKVLHRNSIYPFFLDSSAISEPVGRHMRSAVARRRIEEAMQLPPEQWDLREHCSFTHYVFPNCISVHHPDYSSFLTFYPVGPEKMRWIHYMLIPADRNTEEQRPHWENTFNLIEETVFQREDVRVAEGMQAGMRSGANEALTIGRMEYTIKLFHDSLQQALDEAD